MGSQGVGINLEKSWLVNERKPMSSGRMTSVLHSTLASGMSGSETPGLRPHT